MGISVCRTLFAISKEELWLEEINEMLIVLIPKVECPQKVNQLHLIILCNVTLKLATKSILYRLKKIDLEKAYDHVG